MSIGAQLVLMYKWDAAEAVRLIDAHRVTAISGVPIVMRQLLDAAVATGTRLPSVVTAASGGAPVPPDLIGRIGTQLDGRAAPGTGYGMTETTGAVVGIGGAEYLAHPTSVGRPLPHRRGARDGRGWRQPSPPGQVGEFWVRGPTVIAGYWNDPAATAAAFTHGWFRTGDLGRVDASGLHHIVDRKKDVVIRGGENVYCAEVEAALLAHALVKDAAVLGLPDADYGERVAAVVQVDGDPHSARLADDIRDFVATSLAAFKVPSVLRLVDADLPRTATGKVLKREIRRSVFGVQ